MCGRKSPGVSCARNLHGDERAPDSPPQDRGVATGRTGSGAEPHARERTPCRPHHRGLPGQPCPPAAPTTGDHSAGAGGRAGPPSGSHGIRQKTRPASCSGRDGGAGPQPGEPGRGRAPGFQAFSRGPGGVLNKRWDSCRLDSEPSPPRPPPAPDTNFIPHTWWARRPVSTVSVPEGRGVFASRERARGSHSGTHQAVTTERTKTSPLIRTQGFCSKAVAKNAKSGRGRWRGSRPDTLGQGQTEAPDRNPQGAPAAPSKTRRGNGRTVLTRAAGEGDPRPVTSCPRTGARAPGVLWAPKARHEGAAPSREESVP